MDDLSLPTCIPPRFLAQPIGYIVPLSDLKLEPQMRHELIAQAAYFRAHRRGFEPGHDLEDWQSAEVEIDILLNGTARNC